MTLATLPLLEAHRASRLLQLAGLCSVSTPPASQHTTQSLLSSSPFPWWLTLCLDLMAPCRCRHDTSKRHHAHHPPPLSLCPSANPAGRSLQASTSRVAPLPSSPGLALAVSLPIGVCSNHSRQRDPCTLPWLSHSLLGLRGPQLVVTPGVLHSRFISLTISPP